MKRLYAAYAGVVELGSGVEAWRSEAERGDGQGPGEAVELGAGVSYAPSPTH